MGTSNFHSRQASKIFAITEEYANEFGDNVWSDTRSNIVYELLAIDKDKGIDWEFWHEIRLRMLSISSFRPKRVIFKLINL